MNGGDMIGVTSASVIAGFVGPFLQWEIAPLLALVAAGAVFGGIAGIKR